MVWGGFDYFWAVVRLRSQLGIEVQLIFALKEAWSWEERKNRVLYIEEESILAC